MQKIYKAYEKARKTGEADIEPLSEIFSPPPYNIQQQGTTRRIGDLTSEEKKYLLAAERGDIATVKYYLEEASNMEKFDINAVDPLGRSALYIAIEYENIEMIELLLNNHVYIGEALLHAINEEFVEAVEMLLNYIDNGGNLEHGSSQNQTLDDKKNNESHKKHSLFMAAAEALKEEKIKEANGLRSKWTFLINALKNKRTNKMTNQDSNSNLNSKSFTTDITPLILASHKDNYEIIKILLDRNEQIPEPHDVRCSCHECIRARSEDSLKYSKSRINAYRALASPSLISLSSKDPILTAFQLSWELKRLSRIENEFKTDYEKLSIQCQEYASALLAETRTSQELEIILNHDHENPPSLFENEQEKNNLSRLKLAIKYKQKKFVAHPHCQQLLVSFWYDGISGYRRRNIILKILVILLIALMFPFLSVIYLIMPHSKLGKILRQPFIKFISHSASYICFLFLLILASLRIESFLTGVESMEDHNKEKRGPKPTSVEWMIFCYVASFVWSEIKQLYNEGLIEYLHDWWNLLDFITNSLYITTIVLKVISYIIVQNEINTGKDTYNLNREKWDPWDPTLISEGIFAIANVFSSLKLVYMFTINPHLGPLQISLGRMVFDIMKFAVFILLVVFSFSCGLNQLYWYYAQMRSNKCTEKVFEDAEEREECFLKIKYFSNLFEALQTLYWGIFGLIDKDRLESLYRKHTFTMFIGLLMFGTYCCIMIIVLINMLIAMMSSSYQLIANQADEEWKFARSKLWVSYFEEGATLPAPFNIIPSPKSIYYLLKWFYKKLFCSHRQKRKQQRWLSIRKIMRKISEREYKYQGVIKEIVKRYIMRKQQRDLNAGVTEDDLNEIKQDISSLRFELLEILKNNSFKVDVLKHNPVKRKRGKLNLEKAMAKNIFDETGSRKGLHIFDSLKMNAKNNSDNNFKNSKKSNCSNSFRDNQNRENPILKEFQETGSFKSKSSSGNQTNTPAMYRIALKLKRLTEAKLKKSNSESVAALANKDDFDSKENFSNEEKYLVQNAVINEEVNELDNDVKVTFFTDSKENKISFIESDEKDSFQERITEV
ncbi:unnamed protein product [Brachionus calyciflorus]|uniref:Transient receptor ion channel domain-containing protein n=1 Tax=Brachionus calyciflorus TaxID=104777 RepID=A0A813TCK8_9BILA|nr:unnamed protein product [Brachionus calyciflorus]